MSVVVGCLGRGGVSRALLISIIFVFNGALNVGCARVETSANTPHYSAAVSSALSGQILLGHSVQEAELPNLDVFAITPEMALFARAAIKHEPELFGQVNALHKALLLPQENGGRGITYSALTTQLPQDTFQSAQANCLSFTLLYVALARHLGINVDVYDVEIPPSWDMRNRKSFIFLRHVNARVPLRHDYSQSTKSESVVIDLEMRRYSAYYPQHAISDALTAAQYYSNRGMELLSEGKTADAFLYLRKALQQSDQQSYLWNNLGSIYNQQNILHEAEVLYVHGLTVKPDDLSIMNNLSGLYRKMGNIKQYEYYRQLTQRHRQANPYYQYMLSLSDLDNGNLEGALHFIKRAIAREKNDERFYALAATIYEKLGDTLNAEKMHKKYQAMSVSKN
jgi:Flp pilus assembly protein TadD